jgi:hypothetical protein
LTLRIVESQVADAAFFAGQHFVGGGHTQNLR